ncbi:sulfite exporter TauE/SafE family protein [Ideonella azotifigens]|uniref:Urease accessory protein UreH-like transmembrane domain-containing protein n=1 Tax=Ideonella azotifigens TaxID=513160 RepID=A0ABN1JUI4_9BURK|nr:sulfite exporter TauE/SafE family protein [Ideonella azotifigens]MCD2341145.1 sulfite exporter TauE/SafE family protein [Ideonella azotifigens]
MTAAMLPLVLAGLAMGVAASPHCASMCAGPCAALTGGCGRNLAGFQLGRLVGYMAGGALAAASVAALGAWSQAVPALRPLWVALHLALLALGLWWLLTGRLPAALLRDGASPVRWVGGRRRPWRAGLAGLGWVALPCGALQAGLLLATLANDALGGALVMAAFALGSMPALALAPWLWTRWQSWRGQRVSPVLAQAWGYRMAGAGLVLGSGWALSHGLLAQFAAWCVA